MAAVDVMSGVAYDYNNPAYNAEAVTPADGADLNFVSRALWVGGAGAISVIMAGKEAAGETVLLSGIPAGTLLPIAVARVRATGTTATLIVALR